MNEQRGGRYASSVSRKHYREIMNVCCQACTLSRQLTEHAVTPSVAGRGVPPPPPPPGSEISMSI